MLAGLTAAALPGGAGGAGFPGERLRGGSSAKGSGPRVSTRDRAGTATRGTSATLRGGRASLRRIVSGACGRSGARRTGALTVASRPGMRTARPARRSGPRRASGQLRGAGFAVVGFEGRVTPSVRFLREDVPPRGSAGGAEVGVRGLQVVRTARRSLRRGIARIRGRPASAPPRAAGNPAPAPPAAGLRGRR